MTKKRLLIIVLATCVLAALAIGIFMCVHKCNKEKINFIINDTLPDGNGREARVILLGGQSNAAGCSIEEYLKQKVSEEEYLEYKNGYDNIYIDYYVSGNNESKGFVKTSTNQGETELHFGPEVGLANKLHELYPDQLIFIIKCTWSGTNLFEQWLSPSSDGKTGRLYTEFVRYVNKNMKYLVSKGYKPVIEGMCWMQGESDSFSVENATDYKIHLENFIKDIRKEFSKYASNDGIAFVDAYIADNPVYWVYCDLVNDSKRQVAELSPLNVVIDTNYYELTCNQEPEGNPDMAHYDSLSQIKLGQLFAEYISIFF